MENATGYSEDVEVMKVVMMYSELLLRLVSRSSKGKSGFNF